MHRPAPQGYSLVQILLHWAVAALVLAQFLLGDAMEDAWKEVQRGRPAEAEELFFANLHAISGIAIFILALARIGLRLRRGAPPFPAGTHPLARIAASLTHLALYGMLLAMPLAGMTAWFLGVEEAGDWHESGATLLLVLVGLHAAGALAEHFVMRTDVLKRMLAPEPGAT